MSSLENNPSKPSFLDCIRLRLVTMEGDDEGGKNAFSRIARKIKNITSKTNKSVDKAKIRVVKAAPVWDDIVPGTQGPTTAKHKNKGSAIFFHGTDIPIMNIVKDLSLSAPPRIKPALRYVYGDFHAPANLDSFEPKNMRVIPISSPQYEIGCLLENFEGRLYCKEDIIFRFQSVLCECSSEELEDMVKLFICQKHILPLELAQGILSKQATDKRWQKEMRTEHSLMLPKYIQPKKRLFKKSETIKRIRAGARPGPSSLAKELLVDEDAQNTAPNPARTDSNTGAITTDTDETLVDGANDVLNQTAEPEDMNNEEAGKFSATDVAIISNSEDECEADVDDGLILLANGFKYNPLAHTVVRNSVKLERSESIYSKDSDNSTRPIRRRILRLVGF